MDDGPGVTEGFLFLFFLFLGWGPFFFFFFSGEGLLGFLFFFLIFGSWDDVLWFFGEVILLLVNALVGQTHSILDSPTEVAPSQHPRAHSAKDTRSSWRWFSQEYSARVHCDWFMVFFVAYFRDRIAPPSAANFTVQHSTSPHSSLFVSCEPWCPF